MDTLSCVVFYMLKNILAKDRNTHTERHKQKDGVVTFARCAHST